MAISLVHPNERYTGILCLLVKYLLWQCATFGNTITFRTVGASTLNSTLRIFLWNISKNNILEFGIYWQSICLGSVLFGQIFVTTISLAVFWIVRASHLLRAWWMFFWDIPKNNILEFGAYYYGINPGSVLGGQFLGNAICLADFGIVCSSSFWAEWYGSYVY